MIKSLIFYLAMSMAVFGQGYSFSVTPNSITATIDKYGGTQVIQTPIVVNNTTSTAKVMQIQVGKVTDNTGNFSDSMFTTNTILGPNSLSTRFISVGPSQTANIYLVVDSSKLDIGSYTVPIGIYDQSSSLVVSSFIFLQVADNRVYSLPISGSVPIPHIATGKQWITSLQFINTSDTTSTALVKVYDPKGAPLIVKLADGRVGNSFYVTVFGNGTDNISFADLGNADTIVGTALVQPFQGAPMAVQTLYFNQNGTGNKVSTIVNSSTLSDKLSVFYDYTGDSTTGFAISSSLNYDQTLNLTYYDNYGNVQASGSVVIPAMGQYLTSLNVPATKNKQGTIKIKGIGGLSGMALKFNADLSFVTMSVVQ